MGRNKGKGKKKDDCTVSETTQQLPKYDAQKVHTQELSSGQSSGMQMASCSSGQRAIVDKTKKSNLKIEPDAGVSRQLHPQTGQVQYSEQPKCLPAPVPSVWDRCPNITPTVIDGFGNRTRSETELPAVNLKKKTSASVERTASGMAPAASVWDKPRTSSRISTPISRDVKVGSKSANNKVAGEIIATEQPSVSSRSRLSTPVVGHSKSEPSGKSSVINQEVTDTKKGKDIGQNITQTNITQPLNSQQGVKENIKKANPEQQVNTTESLSANNKAAGDFQFAIPTRKISNRAGTLGRKTKVFTNFFPLCINSKLSKAIHYDVTFTPDRPKSLVRIAFNKMVQDHFPGRYPAFDGSKNIYSSTPLFDSAFFNTQLNIVNPENNRVKEFEVYIKFAAYVDLSSLARYMNNRTALQIPQEALQCIDVVFRNILSCSNRFVQVGRSFFTPPTGRVIDLEGGMQLWHGVFTSAVLGWKPYLNIDVAHKGFPIQQLVTEYMQNSLQIDLKNGKMSEYQRGECRKFLKGLRTQYILPQQPQSKRTYKVNDISKLSAREQTFTTDDGSLLSIESYYRKMKNYAIQFPNLPCLWVGSTLKSIYVPPELCTILPGQVVLKKLTENQTKNMIRNSATSTQVRRNKINDALLRSGLTEDQPGLREFGLRIDNRFEEVDARILQAPTLEYSNGTTVEPALGIWKQKRFLTGAVLRNWTILNVDFYTQPRDLISFSKQIMDRAKDLGMDVKHSDYKPPYSIKGRHIDKELQQYFEDTKKDNIDLVFVIVPNAGETYSQVKQAAELQYGILTQCLKAQTLRKMNISTIDNILLKVNAKLNGTNHIISNIHLERPSVLNTPVIIVGADVTHPSPDQINIPSVVGVAASHDPAAFKYNMCWRLQSPKVEIIEDLEMIMRDHLLGFYVRTNQKPSKILFFRDGVSEGQFKQVLNSELMAIRRACISINAGYTPAITMMVVQKRHHTRFFPNEREGVGKNMNVPPGTVVDTQITHPTELDFYLVSHQSIQGVARPTKYRKLWDDSNMSDDAIEELTYYLCHMFSRCTRAVSYPAPTYYAHLAAYRGRVYLEGRQIMLNNLKNEQRQRQIHEDIQKKKPMFFV